MLHEFITAYRETLIARCREKVASRPVPLPTDAEIKHGVPMFLDQLTDSLRERLAPNPAMNAAATRHGRELREQRYTIAQVVHDYGGICQAITELAVEEAAPITAAEFQTLNLCLDDAIAEAVTEYARLRETEGTERLGRLAHELRNFLNSAVLAFDALRSGNVGLHGSTSQVLTGSLAALGRVIDRELAEVRLGVGVLHLQDFGVAHFLEDVEVAARLDAEGRGLALDVTFPPPDVVVRADRQILVSVVGNLLQNAFKFSRDDGRIALRASTTADRVRIEVEDQCGGLPEGAVDAIFAPFEQRGDDRSGLGLGLSICHRGAKAHGGSITVRDRPGVGCVFTLDLPRAPAQA